MMQEHAASLGVMYPGRLSPTAEAKLRVNPEPCSPSKEKQRYYALAPEDGRPESGYVPGVSINWHEGYVPYQDVSLDRIL